MKPVIGITPSIEKNESTYPVHRAHCDAIKQAGGLPLILPYGTKNVPTLLAQHIDGLYITGGYDIDPHYFNEEPHPQLGQIDPLRDKFELALVHEMIALKKPILGICRGSQIINVALGGTMYQDLSSQKGEPLIQHIQNRPLHYPSHYIKVEKSSFLYRIVKHNNIKVNSNHHQANNQLGRNLRVSAISEDGVIEAIEREGELFVIGVQWHPERLIERQDEASQLLYAYFVSEA